MTAEEMAFNERFTMKFTPPLSIRRSGKPIDEIEFRKIAERPRDAYRSTESFQVVGTERFEYVYWLYLIRPEDKWTIVADRQEWGANIYKLGSKYFRDVMGHITTERPTDNIYGFRHEEGSEGKVVVTRSR